MKKRIIAFLMVLTLIFSLSGCKKTNEPSANTSEPDTIIEQEIIVEDTESTVIDKEEITSSEAVTSSEEVSSNETTSSKENVSSKKPTSSKTEVSSKETTSSKEKVSSKTETSSEKATSSKTKTSSQSVTSSKPMTSSKTEVSSVIEKTEEEEEIEMIDIDYEWKSHPEDFKLIAFTFDDGPSSRMQEYVTLFSAFEGAGTFFVNGNKIDSDYKYSLMQNAINYGWDIGNHGDNHLVATIGGVGGSEATYDQIKSDILNLTNKLHTNLKNRDGSPYEVSVYRAPNIKPTANTFKICSELNYPIIWLADDALDWDQTKTDKDRENVFKNGLKNWKDGDIILCHEVQQFADQTYKNLEVYLPMLYRAGYRFCSVTELMELRGISRSQISGELNNVDGNRGMVTNIVAAAAQGKK